MKYRLSEGNDECFYYIGECRWPGVTVGAQRAACQCRTGCHQDSLQVPTLAVSLDFDPYRDIGNMRAQEKRLTACRSSLQEALIVLSA